MKRLGLCVAIFVSIITVSVYSLFVLHKNNEKVIAMLDDVMESYENDDDDVADKVNELDEYWEDYYIKISFVTRSNTLDDISYSVDKLRPMYEHGSDEFISECESIKYWVKRVYDSQFPHFYSVF